MPTQTSLSAVADSNGDGSQEPEAKPDPGHEADVSEKDQPQDSRPTQKYGSSSSGSNFVNVRSMSGDVVFETENGMEDWVAEKESADSPYAYFNIELAMGSTLSGVEMGILASQKTVAGEEAQLHSQYGSGLRGVSRPEVAGLSDYFEQIMQSIVDWKLGLLSYPQHPVTRAIPDEDVRVFLPAELKERMKNEGVDVDEILSGLNNVGSAPPEIDHIQSVSRYNDQVAVSYGNIPEVNPKKAVRVLENVLKVGLGIDSGSVPTGDRYSGCSFEMLRSKLETARSANEASRELKSQLSKSQGEFRQSWITQAKKDEFAQLFSEVEPNQ